MQTNTLKTQGATSTQEVDQKPELPMIPYFPSLRPLVHSQTAALIMAVFELFFPAPEPVANRGRPANFSEPILVGLDELAIMLGHSRRTLLPALSVLCVWWRSPEARLRAQHSGREFLNPAHSKYGTAKPYSATGENSQAAGCVFILRRNLSHPAFAEWNRLLHVYAQTTSQPSLPAPLLPTAAFHAPYQHSRLAEVRLDRAPNHGGGVRLSTDKVLDVVLGNQVVGADERRLWSKRLVRGVDRGLLPELVLRRITKAAERLRREKPGGTGSRLIDKEDARSE